MPESDNNEFGLNHMSHVSSDSISRVPIKKRLFRLSQCSYPMSQEPDLSPQDCGILLKRPSCLEPESTVSDKSTDHVLHSDKSGWSFSAGGNFSTESIHESLSQASSQEFGVKNARFRGQGTSIAGLTIGDKSFGLSVMDHRKLMSNLNVPPEPSIEEGDIGSRSSSSVNSTYLANSGWQLTSSSDANNHGRHLIKKEKPETCSLDLLLPPQRTFSETNANIGPANRENRLNLDLNIPNFDMWDTTVSEFVNENSMRGTMSDIDKYKKKIEACSVQTFPLNVSGSDFTSGKSITASGLYDLSAPNLGMPADNHEDFELGLDLQLKPPSRPELCIKLWRAVAPDLSLSLEGNVSNASSRAMQPEPAVDNSHKGTMNFQLSGSKLVGFRHVNSEPCNGNLQDGTAKVTCYDDQKQAARTVVKMEPPEEPSKEYFNRTAVRTSNKEFDNNKSTHRGMEVSPSMVEPIDLNSVTVSDENVIEADGSVMIVNTNINTGQITCGALTSVVNPASEESCKAEETLDSTCNLLDAEGSATKAADVNIDSLISDAKENLIGTVTPEDACLASNPFHESTGPVAFDGISEGSAEMNCSDDEYYTSSKLIAEDSAEMDSSDDEDYKSSNLIAEDSAEMDSSDDEDYKSSKLIAEDNLHLDSMGKCLGDEKKQDSMNLSSKIQEHYDGSELPDDSPHAPSVARDEVFTHGAGVGEYKNCEPRDLVPHGAIEVSCEEGERADNEMAAGSTAPVDIVVQMPSNLEVTDKQIQSDARTSTDEGSDGNLCNDKNDTGSSLTMDLNKSSGVRVPTMSRSTRFTKPSKKANRDGKGPPIKSKFTGSPSSKVVKTSKSDISGSGQQVNAKESDVPIKNLVSLEIDSDTSGLADQQLDDSVKCSQIRKVSSLGTTKLSSGKMNSIAARLVFSQTEKKGLIDKSHRRERSHSWGSRDERSDDKRLKYGSNDQDQLVRKRYSDMMNTRRDDNHMSAHGRDSGPQYAPKLVDPKGYRFTRHNGNEFPLRITKDDSVGSAGRIIRKFMDDEPPHFSRFAYRRHSPGAHDGPSMGIQVPVGPPRDVSPNRFIGRHVPDNLPDHEKIMRALPSEVMNPFFYADPCVQYEQAENHSMWRERSLSPIQRRGPPIHLPRACSPYQCSQPRRSPDMIYEGHPEMRRRRCRSPPVVKIDQLRSPPRPLCFSEYARVRNGSPLHSRLPCDMREMHSIRELDLPRPGRGSQRNIKRFNLSGQQENTENDYFETLPFAQLPAHVDDELFERRKFDNRRIYLQSYGNHHPAGDDGDEPITYPVHDGPPRPIRFFSNREGFSNRGSLRDPVVRMKNQPGSTTNRSKRIAEREDFRKHGSPAWHDCGFNDARPKRRRV